MIFHLFFLVFLFSSVPFGPLLESSRYLVITELLTLYVAFRLQKGCGMKEKIEDNHLFIFCYHQLRSTDTDTAMEIRHGGTLGHGKFQKTRLWLRQGHGIIR